MWNMTYVCSKWLKMFEKRPKYVRTDIDMREMAIICGEMA